MYGRLRVPYNYSADTAACLMVKKSKYLEVGGLEEDLKVALAEIAETAVGSTTSLSMSKIATTINAYIDEYSGSSAVDVSNSSYSWTKYKNRIADEKPCILYIGAGDTTYWEKAHAVVGVGYTGGATSSSGYLIVNSGFQSYKYVNILTTIPGYIIK